MANSFNIPNSISPGGAGAAKFSAVDPPPSLPLQIFLFCAFLVTAGAYVVSQRAGPSDAEGLAGRHNEKLHQLFLETTKYQNFTKLGFQAEYQKHYDAAVSNFHNAMLMESILKQNKAEAHYNLANALLLQNKANTNQAFAEFKAALRVDPTMRDVYTSWGQALMDQGKPEEAEQIYRQAVQQNAQFSLTHFKLGLALAARQKSTEALDEFGEAAKLGLDDADFWFQYGVALNAKGNWVQAEADLAKAAALRPDLADLHFQLAVAQQNQGKFTEAISQYETMLTQKPEHPGSLNNLALIYATASDVQARNPKLAVAYATRASTAAGDQNPRFLDTLARSYAADGDFLQAALWENKAVAVAKLAGDKSLLTELSARVALFQQHKAE